MKKVKPKFWYFTIKSTLAVMVGAYLKLLGNPYAIWILGFGLVMGVISMIALVQLYREAVTKRSE
jgi:uncharacterized membrane protein AbrB (regulator of aidB expression)